jgi:stage II sporulation protein D
VTIDGRWYTCAHPDLKRPLTLAEVLAYSCNDFFVSLASRLPRATLNDLRTRVGLPPVDGQTNYAAALVGLDGPRVTPRALLDILVRLVGRDRDRPVSLSNPTRQVVIDGLRGAASFGSVSELSTRNISALAMSGTASMPGDGMLGLVVVLTPADAPTRGAVVLASGAGATAVPSIAADLLAGGTARRGATVRVGVGSGGRTRIETLALEDYVARVLAGEGQPRAGDAAQQALAIAIRTFALANRNRHRREGFDMCDTTHCQVLRPSTAVTRRAADMTAGRVLVHQNQPAAVFYSAWCGGRSELPSQVWPGAMDYAFEPAQEDDACRDEPQWSAELDVREIERALSLAGLRGNRLRNLRVIARSPSGRITRLRAEGFTPEDLSGDDFRMAAGGQRIRSTMFEVRRSSGRYVFTGRGFGHGVGMCVIGAGARAARGDSAEAILRFYYPGLQVQHYAPAALTNVARPPESTPAAGPPTRAVDLSIALPAAEEGERTAIMQLVRRARDEIAAAARVEAPTAIRVTVHPDVESFNRATGQPWWVSGTSERSTIDLLPLTVLKQRGQFERTIRREVAHVMLDSALADRPMWVREGAALYFSSPLHYTSPPPRVPCPADEEFLRPRSAGAHRDAHARAEACFSRQIMDGRTWREVR